VTGCGRITVHVLLDAGAMTWLQVCIANAHIKRLEAVAPIVPQGNVMPIMPRGDRFYPKNLSKKVE
jgi:hypothetical protein